MTPQPGNEQTYIVKGKRLVPFSELVVARNAGDAGDVVKRALKADGHGFIPSDIRIASPIESMES